MSNLLFSFILPSYNREKTLYKVLAKLTEISSSLKGEIVVVDNKSEDNTVKMIQNHYPHVRLHCADTNLGTAARNLGLEMSRGRYVFMLDDDSYPLPGSVERGIEILQSDTSIGCVAYRIEMSGGRYWSNGIYTVFTGCGALFPAHVLKEIGGYPEDFLYYAEEYDVAFRLWGRGYRVVNVKDPLVFHEKTFNNENFEKRLAQLVRNNAIVYSRYLPREWAIDRIEYENWRYKAIGKKEGAVNGYIAGLNRAISVVCHNLQSDTSRLSEDVVYRTLGLAQAMDRLKEFREHNKVKRTVIVTAGKLLPEIIKMVRSDNIDIVAVVEDNKFMIGDSVEGVGIVGYDRLKDLEYDCFISGSSSLTVNDQIENYIGTLPSKVKRLPFFRTCEYDVISV